MMVREGVLGQPDSNEHQLTDSDFCVNGTVPSGAFYVAVLPSTVLYCTHDDGLLFYCNRTV
jgi:hypothetical protein